MEAEATIKAAEVRAAEFALQVIDYELAQARAVLERPEGALSDNIVEVKSPVSGRVLKVMQESETVVTPGTPILEIGDPADIEIEAEILSRDAVAIQPGDAVDHRPMGRRHTRSKAASAASNPPPSPKSPPSAWRNNASSCSAISIDPPEAAQRWATATGSRCGSPSGTPTTCWWSRPAPCSARATPGKPLSIRTAGPASPRLRPATPTAASTEVLSGLKAGDKVLLHPPDTVKDGTPVKERGH